MRTALFPLFSVLCSFMNVGAALAVDEIKVPTTSSDPLPLGSLPPVYRVPGVRASTNLATVVHCTNLESTSVTVYATFYQYTGIAQCTASSITASQGTRSLGTNNVAAFALDAFCSPAASIGQGQAVISVVPTGSRILCSAEIISITGDPPTTLTALDVYRAN